MISAIRKFVLDESGLETVEWAIVGGVVVAIGAAVFITIGTDAQRGLNSLSSATNQIP